MDPRYASEVDHLFTPRSHTDWMARISVEHARVRAGVDSEPLNRFTLDRIATRTTQIEHLTGHDVASLVQAVREVFPELATQVHFGLTSSDLADSSLAIRVHMANRGIERQLLSLDEALSNRGDVDGLYTMRTHGQPAVQIDATHLWESFRTLVLSVQFVDFRGFRLRGPAGDRGDAAEREVCERLGFRPSMLIPRGAILQIAPRQTLVAAMRGWVDAVTACEQIAMWVRLQASWGTVREPTGVTEYKGSSVLYHKRNPTRSERICGLARVARANLTAVQDSVVQWDGRDIAHSSVERLCVGETASIASYVLAETCAIVRDLEIDYDIAIKPRADDQLRALTEQLQDPEAAYRQLQGESKV